MKKGDILSNIKANLNYTGVFLEEKVHTALDRHPIFVSQREYPYSSMNLINDRIPDIVEGTMDVFAAAKINKEVGLCLCIECKKADPKQKHWVFQLRTSGKEIYPFEYYDFGEQINGLNYDKNIFFPALGYNGMRHFDKAIQCFEFKEASGGLSNDPSKKTYAALEQANRAIKAVVPVPKIVWDHLFRSDPFSILYLPVVVTTANLWVIDYNPRDISWETGEIDETKLELKEKYWVHYEFPLPVNLKLGRYEKRPTFIVRAEKFSDFIGRLLSDVENYILDWPK